jgi:hypothetical protein
MSRVCVCLRIRDLPVPHAPSREALCVDCAEPVWLSHATEADLRPFDVIVCRPCANVRREAEDEEPEVHVGPNTRRAVEAWRKEQGWTQR